MSESTGGTNHLKRTAGFAALYTIGIFTIGFAITYQFFQPEQKSFINFVVYGYHGLFYSACLGTLLALMFHEADEA